MRVFHGVIFDVDGTLVASNDAHAHAWVEAFAEQGIIVSFEAVRKLIGMGGDKLLPRVAGIDKESSVGKNISTRRGEIFKERYLPHLQPTPGAAALVYTLHEKGFKLAVASSAEKDELQALLKVCSADGLIDIKTSAADADRSKPDPDIVQAALAELGLPLADAVMVGDTPYDVEAAKKAGIAIIAVRCGGSNDEELKGALAIYDDPAAILRSGFFAPSIR